jgi:Na+/H+-translocating membrane pyrophosphatase
MIKAQLILSCILQALVALPLTLGSLPRHIYGVHSLAPAKATTPLAVYGCYVAGLGTGLGTGLLTEFYTSNEFSPVRDVAESAKSGAATEIIFGLALGYRSVVAPILFLSTCIVFSFHQAGFLGVSIAALGMLGNLATTLTIDGFGPVADNAGGLAELSSAPLPASSIDKHRLTPVPRRHGRRRARAHRRARRGGQHERRHRQGLRHRLRGARQPVALRSLYRERRAGQGRCEPAGG